MKPFLASSIALLIAFNAVAESDPWAVLRAFDGKWEGPSTGRPGKGSTSREFWFELNGRFLFQRDKSIYRSEDPAATPVVHEDFGVFSYDRNLKKVVWRQFHGEGLVNEYTLESVSADGKSLEFVTTKIENLPPGFRAKKAYRILSADEIQETFSVAPTGKDFEVYTVTHLKRVN
jgi:hypothetical protein